MKRLLLVWVMILCMVPIYACTNFDYSMRDYGNAPGEGNG